MKEIKAYIQRSCVEKAVKALEKAGAPGITIVEIHPVGYGYEPNYFSLHTPDTFERYAHLRIVKMEIVCADQDASRFEKILCDACCTGAKGDGRIFISDVSRAVRIRDGATGDGDL